MFQLVYTDNMHKDQEHTPHPTTSLGLPPHAHTESQNKQFESVGTASKGIVDLVNAAVQRKQHSFSRYQASIQ
jgi:hypothetical protein